MSPAWPWRAQLARKRPELVSPSWIQPHQTSWAPAHCRPEPHPVSHLTTALGGQARDQAQEGTQIKEGWQRSWDLWPRSQASRSGWQLQENPNKDKTSFVVTSKLFFEFDPPGLGSTHCPGADSQPSLSLPPGGSGRWRWGAAHGIFPLTWRQGPRLGADGEGSPQSGGGPS